jgi:hypothetical protein
MTETVAALAAILEMSPVGYFPRDDAEVRESHGYGIQHFTNSISIISALISD